ncbi:MAG TPA: peptide chain release factor 1 [Dehalococcoidales bacterium]|nr:peptide chain release factor 1 [Dehalococcoidales bacterium]
MIEQLEKIEKRYEELTLLMASEMVLADPKQLQALGKERSGMEDVVARFTEYKATLKSISDTQSMLQDDMDEEMAGMVKDELKTLQEKQSRLESELKEDLIPKDPNDEKNVIMEIRAGTGGDEAALFAADLYRMYSRYAMEKRWAVEVLNISEGGEGGYKEIIFEVRGKGVYSRLKYERGVHRVQRVPVTEASGRIHTSTATVAVLAEAEEVDIDVDESDLRVDIFHSSGAGGQNVNKVATAVRLTHLPTGLVVVCQDERSQLRNRQKAMMVLRSRLLDAERRKQEEAITEERRSQVGSGERAEKIRTYNFPQDRITDHRIGQNFHNLPGVMNGNLDDIINAMIAYDRGQMIGQAVA